MRAVDISVPLGLGRVGRTRSRPSVRADDGTRTRGLPADNRMLLPLSYASMGPLSAANRPRFRIAGAWEPPAAGGAGYVESDGIEPTAFAVRMRRSTN